MKEEIPDGAEIRETPAGKMVYMRTVPGQYDLLGFASVTDWDEMRRELRKKGHDEHLADLRAAFPEFNLPE